MTFQALWPILSLLANGVMALAIYSLRTTIKLAIAELKNELSDRYATKADLQRLEDAFERAKVLPFTREPRPTQ